MTFRASTKGILMHTQFRFHLACVLAALTVAGCGQKAVRPSEIASNAGTNAVTKYDANKDGVLDDQELANAPGLRAAVVRIKKLSRPRESLPSESVVKSQKISAAEIDARIGEWKKRGTGRITIICHVIRKGTSQGISGAEVKFVPEDFLGQALTIGTGTTDEKGYAKISQPSRGKDDPNVGMCPGFYRVEITKGSEIPARYNTTTQLGQEVASDAVGIANGSMVFELIY
jgi:hypothetical protein